MSTAEVIAAVGEVKERVVRLSTETEASNTGPQDPFTRDAAKAVRAKLIAAAASLDEAGKELTRMLGAQVNQALELVTSPAECVSLVKSLKGGELPAQSESALGPAEVTTEAGTEANTEGELVGAEPEAASEVDERGAWEDGE